MALYQDSVSPQPSCQCPRTLPDPSAQASRLELQALPVTPHLVHARPRASASCSSAPQIPAFSHSILKTPDCAHSYSNLSLAPTSPQERGQGPQLVSQSLQGWLHVQPGHHPCAEHTASWAFVPAVTNTWSALSSPFLPGLWGLPKLVGSSETENETSMGLGREAQEKSQVEKTGRVTYGRPRAGKTEMPRWTQRETDMG